MKTSIPASAGAAAQGPGHAVPARADASAAMKNQLQLRAMADGSAQVKQLGAMHSMMNPAAPVQKKANSTGLPDNLKAGVESLSGYSLDDVKVHYNSDKPGQLQAHAYAQGSDIHLAPGQEQHLPHEAWHVVQQKQGRVQPTLQMKSEVPVNDDPGLEAEADAMGAKALQMRSDEGDAEPALQQSGAGAGVAQMARMLWVKRIHSGSNLYMGKSTAGPPSLAHGGGTNWYGDKATAAEYGVAPGAMYRVTANTGLNLIDMATSDSVKWAMEETARRRGVAGLSAGLLGALGNFDFAFAIPNAVADVANSYLEYAYAQQAGTAPAWPGDHFGVDQAQMDGALALAGSAADVPLLAGSVIQTFAGHTGGQAVRLDDPNFMAAPDNYRIVRKDATALDANFTNALMADLNDPNMFHGMHVPQGMKFGGWTGTKFEVLIHNSPGNLTLQGQVAPGGPEADMAVVDRLIGVDDSLLARSWRWFGLNGK